MIKSETVTKSGPQNRMAPKKKKLHGGELGSALPSPDLQFHLLLSHMTFSHDYIHMETRVHLHSILEVLW